MDHRALRYVVAVAEHLSFTTAARSLNVSQPALSQQIRQMEDQLGLQLFARTPHRVTVTQGGQLVVDHARRVLESTGRLREAVAAFRGLQRGKLRIGVTQSFNALHLTPVLAAFVGRHAAIDVTALELANSDIISRVTEGSLDLGVAFGPVDAPTATKSLYQDRLMLACAPDHPLAVQPSVPLHDLAGETLALLTSDYGTRRALDRFFEVHEVSPGRVVELDTFASILKLVETGLCVSVMPGPTAGNGSGWGNAVFKPLEPQPPLRSIELVLPPTAARSPAAIAFSDLVVSHFKNNDSPS